MKVALCGAWHVHARDYIKKALALSEVVGVWEEDEARRKSFCAEFNLPAFDSLDALLASDAEGVIVCTSSDTHADVMVKIADAGKHIFTEKVLALTEEDCDRVAEAVARNGINFVISLVHKYRPGPLTVKQVVDSGELGKINYVRFRNCHNGSVGCWLPKHFYCAKECGGGAMIDLGAHGMYLIDWLVGAPDTYRSVFTNAATDPRAIEKNPDGVEDNAVTVMGYRNGCIAINETGFVSTSYPQILEVGGDGGSVIMTGNEVIKRTASTEGKAQAVSLCDPLPSPIEQFLTDTILPGCGLAEAKALTCMMVGAYGEGC